jgi:protein-S-isoprenylcysteine O-methyltransferase Ste14
MNDKPKLTKSGYRRIIVIYGSIAWNAVLFFAAAGRLDLFRAWFYFVLNVAVMSVIFLVFLIRFPEMAEVVNARGEVKISKGWDRAFVILYSLATLLVMPILAGLDVGRYQWSQLNLWWLLVGTFFFFFAMFVSEWALIENKFFETTVRVQKERGQKAISTGPYAIVRHPGYIAFIFLYFAFPLVVGSVYTLFASLFTALLLVIRTALEDSSLQKELPGYLEYTKKVRYRLIPFVW